MTDAGYEQPDDERFARGWATLMELTGGKRPVVADDVARVSPDLARMIVAFGYGDSYSRPGLERAERQIATISALAAQGDCEPQLEVHLLTALDVGVEPERLVELVLHLVPYIGFPRALNLLTVVRRAFERRGISA